MTKKIKGKIFISSRYGKSYIHDRWKTLFGGISKSFDFPIEYTDKPKVSKNLDIIIIGLQRTYQNSMMNLADLDSSIKVLGILGDIVSFGWKYPGNDIKMLDRYDVIMGHLNEVFGTWYPQYFNKYIWLPAFFATHKRYIDIPFNKDPINKCLVAGNTKPIEFYPMRGYIIKNGNPKSIKELKYPGCGGKKNDFVKDKYTLMLNKYFCCVTDSNRLKSKFRDKPYSGIVAKHVEIPATGSLLITQDCKDFRDMGFLPNKHYVPFIGKKDVFMIIDKVLKDPSKYNKIRKEGMELSRSKHSVNNRIKLIEETIKGML